MPESTKLRVMISSRCDDRFPSGKDGQSLSEIRQRLKAEFELIEILGKFPFEVWINEDTPPQTAEDDSWDVCLKEVSECDVLLVLFNGDAGWAKENGDIGICHAELMTALNKAPAKVRLIELETPFSRDARNKRFQSYVKSQSLFRGPRVRTIEDLEIRARGALFDALIKLAKSGVRSASKGKYHSGEALSWSRLNFNDRKEVMLRVLRDTLIKRQGTRSDRNELIVKIDDQDILVSCHAIPAAITVGPAKELVGQPFLKDYEKIKALSRSRGGPVHIIACHKTATEAQAAKLLGFPDATFVNAPFGIFVADNVQKVQFVFIANCRDDATTRHGVQRFFEWLEQTGEEALLAERAQARARIVQAIAKEITK